MKRSAEKPESTLVLTRKTNHMLEWHVKLEKRVTRLEGLMKALKRLLEKHEENK
jgi:hypothetical protein